MTGRRLLPRNEFRDAVFDRDKGACVICGAPAVDAHHVMERRLFTANEEKGGYFLDNGASLCAHHHLACERTDFSVEEVLAAAGITRRVTPAHLEDAETYDKWGNPVLASGQRLRGELYFDEAVQKVLADKLDLFTHWVKYPRTYHLPWSPGRTSDDKVLGSLDALVGQRVVVTVKMDGENSTLYRDHVHARSLDSKHHPSRNWLKSFWGGLRHDIPEFWRVCGENLYARHSIAYEALPSWFMGFSVWNERNVCLSWDETLEWLALLGIVPVEVLYDGPFDERRIRDIGSFLDPSVHEGYVVRVAGEIHYRDFRTKVAKFVRPDHVRTSQHWMHAQIVPNGLA